MKKSRNIYKVLSTAIFVFFLTVSVIQAADIKIALDCPPDPQKCGTYVWSHTFYEHLMANGLVAKEYATEALGGEDEKLDQVSQGLLEVSNSLLSKVGTVDPAINGFWLFFMWDSYEHLDRAINESDLLDWINSRLTKKGVRLLAPVPVGGFSGIANTKKPIMTVDDLKGLRMRGTDKIQAEYLKAWGANTVIIPWPEIYNSLQTGVADGYLNPAIVPTLFKHTEVIKHYADVRIGAPLRVVIASQDWYGGLSDKERKIVDDAVAAANAANRKWLAGVTKMALEGLQKAGVKVTVLSAAERARFGELARPVYPQVVPDDVLKRFMEAAAKYR
jgi:TRAP-type C4-dicarboxylate transport system substrate-binding protein